MTIDLVPIDSAPVDSAVALLRGMVHDHAPVGFACSFSIEDAVLLHLIAAHGIDIRVFTLDTGRLPPETLTVMDAVAARYGIAVQVFRPDAAALAQSAVGKAPDSIFDSRAARQECCRLRKVEPLARALAGLGGWITGQRREQSSTRHDLPLLEWDAGNGLHKANPLADWTTAAVWSFVRDNDIPYNRLYDRFYASIGCAPCTRPIAAGEDLRAGRWWWENPEHRECGIHRRAHA